MTTKKKVVKKKVAKKSSKKAPAKKEKRPIGRPTKYREEYCEQIVEFFDRPTKIVKEKQVFGKNGVEIIEEEVANDFPTFEKFACNIDVDVDTMLDWCKKHENFLGAYKRCKHLQKNILIENGMFGRYNTAFAIFTAKNCTDMRDKIETKIEGSLSLSDLVEEDDE